MGYHIMTSTRCSIFNQLHGNAHADLRPLWGPIMSSIKAGLNGSPANRPDSNANNSTSNNTSNNNSNGNNNSSNQQPLPFTGPQFARAALFLLSKPGCVATEEELIGHLGGYGQAHVDAMVAAKLLSRRPPGQGEGQVRGGEHGWSYLQ
jgi:hypothetical protein